jgi:anti-sigma B factor antagonist
MDPGQVSLSMRGRLKELYAKSILHRDKTGLYRNAMRNYYADGSEEIYGAGEYTASGIYTIINPATAKKKSSYLSTLLYRGAVYPVKINHTIPVPGKITLEEKDILSYDIFMDVQITVEDRTVTCTCLKDIDLYSEPAIREEIEYRLPQHFDSFIFDMNKVNHIDSTGIGMLIFYYNYMSRKGKTFALRGVQDLVLKLFKKNKLDKLMTII